MTPRIPENVPTWLADFGPVTIMDDMLTPRDPNDDDEDEKDDENEEEEPAVIREPEE